MSTLWSPEAVAAYVAGIALAVVAYLQFFGSAREGREADQRQANLRELRTATDTANSLKAFLVPEMRTLEYYLDLARANDTLPQLRVALSTRLEERYGERMRSLPSAFTHVHTAYGEIHGRFLRIDEILDAYAASGTLPTGSTLPDHLFALRSHMDSLDRLIVAARNDFSRETPLPDDWDPSITVQPGRRRSQRRIGR